jgi:hypothetical protein
MLKIVEHPSNLLRALTAPTPDTVAVNCPSIGIVVQWMWHRYVHPVIFAASGTPSRSRIAA